MHNMKYEIFFLPLPHCTAKSLMCILSELFLYIHHTHRFFLKHRTVSYFFVILFNLLPLFLQNNSTA